MYMGVQTCTRCGTEHPATKQFFWPASNCVGGISHICRPCRRTQDRAWRHKTKDVRRKQRAALYRANKDRHKAYEKDYRKRHPLAARVTTMYHGMHAHARQRGLTVDKALTRRLVLVWLQRNPRCECCGKLFSVLAAGAGRMRPDAPSIDRVDSAQGYDATNIALICWRCNDLKGNATLNELATVVAWLRRRQDVEHRREEC